MLHSAVGPVAWTVLFSPILFVLYKVLLFLLDVRRKSKYVSLFPGTDPHPILGHLYTFPGPGEDGLCYIREQTALFPRVMKIWYGFLVPCVTVVHPDTAREILLTSEPKPTDVGGYRLVHKWLGDGLLIAGGAKWARNRRLLTPAFHFDILRPYMKINNSCVEVLLNKLQKKAGAEVEMFGLISLCTLDIILRCAFSYDNDCQTKGEGHPYVKAVNELQEAAVDRLLKPWLYPDAVYRLTSAGKRFNSNCDYVHNVAEDVINKRRQTLKTEQQNTSKKYLDFLDILLTAKDDNGKGLTDLEIRNEVDTFMFEGHDTTASGISWTLFSLASHPQHQRRCQKEIDDLLSDRESHEIEWEDLAHLKYLTMCIKEAMRLHSPVPFIERQTTKDMTVDGHVVAKGTTVDIQLYGLHTNASIWPEPLEYKPERFSSENLQKKDNFAFLPFSAGPRFDLSIDEDRDIQHRMVVVMKTENGMFIRVKER